MKEGQLFKLIKEKVKQNKKTVTIPNSAWELIEILLEPIILVLPKTK